ncbi:hypothetical protein FWF48_00280 [Candidatus Saccharibacteria bacterium]|nr:hypothetical protein [Candidatus Saccharibacteria bacterium]
MARNKNIEPEPQIETEVDCDVVYGESPDLLVSINVEYRFDGIKWHLPLEDGIYSVILKLTLDNDNHFVSGRLYLDALLECLGDLSNIDQRNEFALKIVDRIHRIAYRYCSEIDPDLGSDLFDELRIKTEIVTGGLMPDFVGPAKTLWRQKLGLRDLPGAPGEPGTRSI